MAGMEMPVPFLAIDAYARRYDITGEDFDRLLRFISVIDFAHLEVQRKAAEPPKTAPEGKRKNS